MIVVVGGAYQGKLEYTREFFSDYFDEIQDAGSADFELNCNKAVLNHFHIFCRNIIEREQDFCALIKNNISLLQNKIIVSDDIFCGVIPLSAKERFWREELGRTLIYLTNQSDIVIRVFCGIGSRLK